MIVSASCTKEPDFESLRKEILDLHHAAIKAHLDKDAGFFVRGLAGDYFTAGKGTIRMPTNQQIINQFENYFSHTEFLEYRDLEEPVIGFSEDASLAWCLVKVRVAGMRTMDVDSSLAFKTDWSWITLYQRDGDRWLRKGVVSSHNGQ